MIVIIALTVLTWPVETIEPVAGMDPSWEVALQLANRDGLQFGNEILFTYGPLGYLTVPRLYFTPQSMAALAFIAVTHLALAATLLGRLTRVLPLVAAAILAYLLMRSATTFLPSQAIVVIGFTLSMTALRPGDSRRAGLLFAGGAGAACGILLLVKVNDAAVLIGVTSLTILARSLVARDARFLALYVAALFGAFGFAWFAAGQAADALPAYLLGSLQLASGYSAAMGTEGAGREWEYGVASLLAAGILALAWRGGASSLRPARAAVIAATALFLFMAFKHGFVRHDGHVVNYFVACALILPALAWRPRSKTWVATSIGALLAISVTSGTALADQVEPSSRVGMFVEQVRTMSDPALRHQAFTDGRASVRRVLGELDAPAIEQLTGHTVHVDPWEASIAWAYYDEFEWRPAPVFQSYSAYTASLDALNATYIASDDGPERILRQSPRSIDGRNPMWESPLYARAMLCNYSEAWAGPNWQVLARTPDRCGAPRVIRRGTYEFTEAIPVPSGRPDEVVIARFHGLEGGVTASLITLLYKPAPTLVNVDDRAVYRLVVATATNGIVVGAPDGARYSDPYSLVPQIDRLTIFTAGPYPPAHETFTVEFVAVPFRAGP